MTPGIVICLLLLCGAVFTDEPSAKLNINNTAVNSDRDSNRVAMCIGSFNVTQSDIDSGNTLSSYYSNQFSNLFMARSVLQNGLRLSNISQTGVTPLSIFVAPHAICLLVMLLLWPALCCCCCCPEKHPASQCCRKKPKEMYTRVELKWTSYILLLATIVCLAGSISGLLKGPQVFSHYNNTVCKLAAILDDTVNGRVSDDGETFFIGMNPMATQLLSLNSKLNTFYTQSQNCFTNANTIKTDGQAILAQVAAQYTSYSNDVYNGAFTTSDGVTQVSVASQFKDMYLGPITDPTKATGLMTSQLTMFFGLIDAALDPMLDAWTYLNTTKTQAVISALLTASATALSDKSTIILGNISSIATNLSAPATVETARLSLSALYGIILSLSILLFVCSICLGCWSVVRIRYIMYVICGILTLLCFISFVCLIISAVIFPLTYETCAYLDEQLKTPSGTQQLFTDVNMSEFGRLISSCMGGDSNIMYQVDPLLSEALDKIDTITTNAQSFLTLIGIYSTNNVKATFSNARDIILEVHNATKLDVNDSVSAAFFTALSNKQYLVDGTCNTTTVNGDCWVPSYTAGTCQSGKSRLPPCNNLGVLMTCPLGCYEIQNTFTNPSGDSGYATHLTARYVAGCKYIDLLVNVQNNYFQQKMNKLAVENSTVNNIETSFNNYDSKVILMKANLGTFSTNLQANFDLISNLQTGALYGTRCQAVKQSVSSFRNALCGGFMNSIHFNLVCLALVSWSIAFIACCVTCSGVRHYQHLLRLQLSLQVSGHPVNISETKIKMDSTGDLRDYS